MSLPEPPNPHDQAWVMARAVELRRTQGLDAATALRIAAAERDNPAQGALFAADPEPEPVPEPAPAPPPPEPEPAPAPPVGLPEPDNEDEDPDNEGWPAGIPPELPLDATLETARDYVMHYKYKPRGCVCPACDRLVKVYARSVSGVMAQWLLDLAVDSARLHEGDMTDFVSRRGVTRGDYSKLRYWGLTANGGYALWRVTGHGISWMRGRSTIAKYAYVLDGEVIGYSDERVSFSDALKVTFDLDEAMDTPEGLPHWMEDA